MTNTFTFNSRDTYKTFRSEWSKDYKAQSQLIRDTKRAIKDARDQDTASHLQYQLHLQRRKANEMMILLTEAKEYKNAQLATSQQAA